MRYDGQHKLDVYLTRTLSDGFEYVPVCPEAELGLGVPREPIRLEGHPDNPQLVALNSRTDLTQSMQAFCRTRIATLDGENLCGYIFKSKSPSCGVERINVYPGATGSPSMSGRGIFAAILMQHMPQLPIEEAHRLHDPALCKRFIERVLLFKRELERADG